MYSNYGKKSDVKNRLKLKFLYYTFYIRDSQSKVNLPFWSKFYLAFGVNLLKFKNYPLKKIDLIPVVTSKFDFFQRATCFSGITHFFIIYFKTTLSSEIKDLNIVIFRLFCLEINFSIRVDSYTVSDGLD